MRKKFFALLLLCISCCGMAAYAATSDTSWYDSSKTEFHISTKEQLSGLRKLVSDGDTFKDKTVILDADIDLSGETWKVGIGYALGLGDSSKAFNGTFDGNNHKIKNFKYNSNLSDTYTDVTVPTDNTNKGHGLFGAIGSTGVVKNVALEGADITAGNKTTGLELSAAALCGVNMGEINTCFVKDVGLAGGYRASYYNHYYAGVVGYNNTTGILDNVWLGKLVFDENRLQPRQNSSAKGGVAAINVGTMTNCYAKKPTYTQQNLPYAYNANDELTSTGTCAYMFWYDPIAALVEWKGAKGTVKNVYSDDSYTFRHPNLTVKEYDASEFHDLNAEMLAVFEGEFSFDKIAYPTVEEVSAVDGNNSITITLNRAIDWENTSAQNLVVALSEDETVEVIGYEVAASNQAVITLADRLLWNTPYYVTFNDMVDSFGRIKSDKTLSFESGSRASFNDFKLCDSSGNQLSSISDVSGVVTVKLDSFKSNEGSAIEDAILSISLIKDGTLVKGMNKKINISTVSAATPAEVSIDTTGVELAEGDVIQAVLYYGIDKLIPLTDVIEIK